MYQNFSIGGPGVHIQYRQRQFRKEIARKFHFPSGPLSDQDLQFIFSAIDLDENGVLDPHEI
jgi:hypothetical protein